MKQYLFIALIVIGSVSIDQATKQAAHNNLLAWQDLENPLAYNGYRQHLWTIGEEQLKDRKQFFVSFSLNYVRNQGAAWGILSDLPGNIRMPFFAIVTLIAIIVILSYMRATPVTQLMNRYALTLILSGAIGNFLDRLQNGYVIDFLDVRWNIPLPFPSIPSFAYNFPNFNWADSCITIGVSCLLIDMVVNRKKNLITTTVSDERKETTTTTTTSNYGGELS